MVALLSDVQPQAVFSVTEGGLIAQPLQHVAKAQGGASDPVEIVQPQPGNGQTHQEQGQEQDHQHFNQGKTGTPAGLPGGAGHGAAASRFQDSMSAPFPSPPNSPSAPKEIRS